MNLESTSAPTCYKLERRLIQALGMPVVHDDQHAPAVMALAALENAAKAVSKDPASIRVVIAGRRRVRRPVPLPDPALLSEGGRGWGRPGAAV